MLILSLDTTSDTSSVALTSDLNTVAYSFLSIPKKHSETTLLQIEHLLAESDTSLSEIDAFAVTVGPGSFTGVRVGVSMIKGLAFASGKSCIAVSTLEALAQNAAGLKGIIACVMDARRNQFYHALFSSDGNGIHRLTPDQILDAAAMERGLQQYQEQPLYFVGDGYALAKRLCSIPTEETPLLLQRLNAASVGMVAYRQYQNGNGIFDDKTISPVYLRASQAERERIEKNKKEIML